MIYFSTTHTSTFVKMPSNMFHTSPPVPYGIGRVMSAIELSVAERAYCSGRRTISVKMGDTVVNPLFERLWMEPQITSGKRKLARQVIPIIERSHEGLVQGWWMPRRYETGSTRSRRLNSTRSITITAAVAARRNA